MQDCLQMPAETKYRCARGINRRRTRASVGNIIGVGGNVVRKWGRAKRPRAGDAAITPAKRRARAKPETVQLRLPRWVAIFLRLLQDCWLSLRPRWAAAPEFLLHQSQPSHMYVREGSDAVWDAVQHLIRGSAHEAAPGHPHSDCTGSSCVWATS